MNPRWRGTQADSRQRYLAKFDAAEVERYDQLVARLSIEERRAYLADLGDALRLPAGAAILDAGAGTGALCGILTELPGLLITALEPVPAMLAALRTKPALGRVVPVVGFCDAPADRALFPAATFDAIVSRQLVNGLFDPLAAFANWHAWLKPGGIAVVIDGLYGRTAWTGPWAEEVDVFPAAACQGTALVPYLLENAGFEIDSVAPMMAVNALPSTQTQRYAVVARKPS